MKTIIKIEIAILVLVLLIGGAMCAISAGVLELFHDPVFAEYKPAPIATDPPAEETVPEETEPVEPAAEEETLPPETEPTVPPTDPETGEPIPTEPREIAAQKYFVYDVRQGEYLKKVGSETEKLYPASITKLLTCYVVLQHLKPEDTVVAGDALELVPEDSSVADIKEGDKLTVEQLIAAMMMPSGNDAAQIAAVAAGRKIANNNNLVPSSAVEAFMDEMNAQAKALGMENSHFVTPDGFHRDNHYTTMNDLVTLCQKVLAEPVILKYASRATETVQMGDRELEWKNSNMLLHPEWEHHQPNTIGLKTGYTDAAGACLISAFFEEDRLLLIGVFGSTPYTEDRYLDTVDIYNSL